MGSAVSAVHVLVWGGDDAAHVEGEIVGSGYGQLEVELYSDSPEAQPGAQVLVSSGPERRIEGWVQRRNGRRIQIEVRRIMRRDARDYPRQAGSIRLEYRPCGGKEADRAWMRGLDPDPTQLLEEPEECLDFSASGIRLMTANFHQPGARLAVQISTPTSGPFRAIARVVRVTPDEGAFELGLTFEELEAAGREALLQYTTELLGQDLMLEEEY